MNLTFDLWPHHIILVSASMMYLNDMRRCLMCSANVSVIIYISSSEIQ